MLKNKKVKQNVNKKETSLNMHTIAEDTSIFVSIKQEIAEKEIEKEVKKVAEKEAKKVAEKEADKEVEKTVGKEKPELNQETETKPDITKISVKNERQSPVFVSMAEYALNYSDPNEIWNQYNYSDCEFEDQDT